MPLAEFHTQSGLIDRLLRTERLLALVSRAFSLAALVLATVGLGGLLAYAVARRTNEIGVRMALLVIAGVASLLPAHRAARINPLAALRDELRDE